MLDQRIQRVALLQTGVAKGLIGETLILKYQLHVLIDGADGPDGAEAADQQQPERPLAQQV